MKRPPADAGPAVAMHYTRSGGVLVCPVPDGHIPGRAAWTFDSYGDAMAYASRLASRYALPVRRPGTRPPARTSSATRAR